MPAHKHPGVRYGGRAKGTKNKGTVEVEETLRRLGCDPIEGMARIAMGLDPDGTPTAVTIDLKAKMLAELAQYVAPKRKAQEITGAEGGPIVVSWRPPPAE